MMKENDTNIPEGNERNRKLDAYMLISEREVAERAVPGCGLETLCEGWLDSIRGECNLKMKKWVLAGFAKANKEGKNGKLAKEPLVDIKKASDSEKAFLKYGDLKVKMEEAGVDRTERMIKFCTYEVLDNLFREVILAKAYRDFLKEFKKKNETGNK